MSICGSKTGNVNIISAAKLKVDKTYRTTFNQSQRHNKSAVRKV